MAYTTTKKPEELVTGVQSPVTTSEAKIAQPAPGNERSVQNPSTQAATQATAQPQTAVKTDAPSAASGMNQPAVQSVQSNQGNTADVSGLLNLPGVSDRTKQAIGGLVANGYTPSQNVTDAMNELNGIIAKQPSAFQSQYMGQLSSILNQILGRGSFQYNAASDPMYQMYAQQYRQQGKQAMQDTMGQAAALTGGYGSSYASTAGNQAYQQYLTRLNDKQTDLYNQALSAYNQEGDRLQQQYSLLNDAYNNEYGRWQDEYSRWQNELANAQNRYDTERNFDYGKYQDDLNYWQSIANAENSQYTNDRSYYYNYLMSMIQAGKTPSADLIARSGLSEEDVNALLSLYLPKKSSSKKKSGGSGTTTKTNPNAAAIVGAVVNGTVRGNGSSGIPLSGIASANNIVADILNRNRRNSSR